MSKHKLALAVHGGAGTILRSLMTTELEREYRDGLESALKVGWEILEKGGSSLDCVEQTACSLENFPLFNAGRGSVFTHVAEKLFGRVFIARDIDRDHICIRCYRRLNTFLVNTIAELKQRLIV